MSRSIRQIRAAKAAGESIPEEELDLLRAYGRKYEKNTYRLSAPRATLEAWREAAKSEGASLSGWIRERVDEALHGTSDDIVEAYPVEIQALKEASA